MMLFSRAVDELVPKIYAGFVMTLHTRFAVDFEDIVYALRDTQRYWQENEDIVSQCYRVTGIDVLSSVSAEEQNIEGGMEV
jgi:hypothetical protein